MPQLRRKGFVSRKRERRLKQVADFDMATKIKILVERLPNQHAYDAFLLQQPDVEKRRKMFEFTRGFCKFADPQFPSSLKLNGLLGPDGRPL